MNDSGDDVASFANDLNLTTTIGHIDVFDNGQVNINCSGPNTYQYSSKRSGKRREFEPHLPTVK